MASHYRCIESIVVAWEDFRTWRYFEEVAVEVENPLLFPLPLLLQEVSSAAAFSYVEE